MGLWRRGSAPPWHGGGRGFESRQLHQRNYHLLMKSIFINRWFYCAQKPGNGLEYLNKYVLTPAGLGDNIKEIKVSDIPLITQKKYMPVQQKKAIYTRLFTFPIIKIIFLQLTSLS